MLELTGNLSDRHRQLNFRVKNAISNNVNFNDLKVAEETSDVDKLFKIDVAIKTRNIDYIVEILKSGDPLYISRAIKRPWLYNNEFSNIINHEYLDQNVFPFMSIHMRKKLLTTIAQYVTDENRAASFFKYCVGIKFNRVAYKFLLFTTESFKFEMLSTDHRYAEDIGCLGNDYLQHFVKDSFGLAEFLLQKVNKRYWTNIFHGLRRLYTVSDVQFLDLMEKYDQQEKLDMSRFGLRLSKDIIKNHKYRVLTKTNLYFKVVNNHIILKNSTVEDVKMYAINLLPDKHFWQFDYCNQYKQVLNLIPCEERFEYVKRIFQTKYPGEKFETDIAFYNTRAYYLMTAAQQEKWALQQITSGLEVLGSGNDYQWYKFVNFNTAFYEIKKYIRVTPDKYNRAQYLKTLVRSAKNQHDLETLLYYLYDRHINERSYIKDRLIDLVISEHEVYDFDDKCWAAFNKILHNLDIYDTNVYQSENRCRTEYILVSIFYHIINRKHLPEPLLTYIDSYLNFNCVIYYGRGLHLSNDQEQTVYEYLLNFYIEKLKVYIQPGSEAEEEIKHARRKYLENILDILIFQDKTKTDCPELVLEQVRLDWDTFKDNPMFCERKQLATQNTLLRLLKKDPTSLIEKLSEVQKYVESTWHAKFKVKQLMRKLKVYFSHDVAHKCLDFFVSVLETSSNTKGLFMSVHSILQLADESFKLSVMEKYVPNVPKIDHENIGKKTLDIQRGICTYVCVSRPPVPLNTLLKYIQGDYIHFCMPIFDCYLAHLPPVRCLEFVEFSLDQPVSIQKHGLRLAFQCFEIHTLMKVVNAIWRKTKNVSLKTIIFKGIFEKILASDESTRDQYFDILKVFIADLNEDDDEELLNIVTCKMPRQLIGQAIEILWETIRKFSERRLNLDRIRHIIENIERYMDLISDEVIKDVVVDTINTSFSKHKAGDDIYTKEVAAVEKAKWVLTAKYITHIRNDEELNLKLELTQRIIILYLDNWDDVLNEDYIVRRKFNTFIENLNDKAYGHDVVCYKYVNVLLETILDIVIKSFPPETVYFILWELKMSIATRKVVIDTDSTFTGVTEIDEKYKKLREICSMCAKELGQVFTDFINKKMYFASLLSKVANEVISPHIDNIENNLDQYFSQYEEFKQDDWIVLLCNELFKLNRPELNLLIVHVLPYDDIDTKYADDYKILLGELNNINDNEVRSNFHDKLYSDLKYKPYLDALK